MPLPLSLVGYFLEPIYLRVLNKNNVITVSESTKLDLMKYGYLEKKIVVISEGIELNPIASLDDLKIGDLQKAEVLKLNEQKYLHKTIHILRKSLEEQHG